MSLDHALLHTRPRYSGLVNDKIYGFSPASLTGLQLWLDASRIVGLSNDDKVSQWNDFSGNSRHAVQANSTYQPIYKTGVQNGLPAVQFGSINGVKLTTPAFGLSTFSLYIVTNQISRNVTYPIIIEQDIVNTGIVILSEASKTIFRYIENAGDIAGSAAVDGTTYLLSFLANTTNLYAWINSTSQGSSNNNAGATARTKSITLGEQNGSGNRYIGYIMEIAIFESSHSEAERLELMNYFNKKWSIY
jgi:hypothetical protein